MTMKTLPRRLALLAITLMALATGLAAGTKDALATLPYYERETLEHAVLDKQYGDVLATELDGTYSVTITFGGKFTNSNNTIIITGKDASRAHHALSSGDLYAKTAGLSAGAMFCYLATDANGINVVATAATTLAIGSNGGYVPVVTGKAGWVILNSAGTATLKVMHAPTYAATGVGCVLQNGRVAHGSTTFSF